MAWKKTKKFQNKRPKNKRRKVGRPSRALTQSIYYFKRSFTDNILLSDPGRGGTIASTQHVGAYWAPIADRADHPQTPRLTHQTDGTYMRLQCKFNNLINWTEFSGLFNQFKMSHIKVECIPQYTDTSTSTLTASQPHQAIAYILPYNYTNERAAVNTLYESQCLETQAAKKKTIWKNGKSFSITSKLKVPGPLIATEATAGTWVPALSSPKWLAFDNAGVGVYHYGLQMRFQPVNYGTWVNASQIKLIYTLYFACKGVV